MVPAIAVGFIEIELDKETGKFDIVDYLGVADCGTVLHPMGLSAQIRSGAVMGFGMGLSERHIYDPQNGLPGNVGLIQAKPPSYLDVPSHMQTLAVDIQDPQNPVGSKGIGEPVARLRDGRRARARSPTRSAATTSTARRCCPT